MATEMIHSLRSTGGDYTDLTTWETDTTTDLTAAGTLVFSHGGITGGAMNDGDSVTFTGGAGATGTIVGVVTSTQIMVDGITGTPATNDVVSVAAAGQVTISDAGDSVIPVLECYDDWPSGYTTAARMDIAGATTSATNYRIVRAATGNAHNGYDYTTGFYITGTSSTVDEYLRVGENNSGIEFIAFDYNYTISNNASCVGALNTNSYCLGVLVNGAGATGAGSSNFGTSLGPGKYLSCYAIGGVRGFDHRSATNEFKAYNCIAKDCTTGFDMSANNNFDIRNCYAYGCTTSYSIGTGSAGSSTTNGADDAATSTPPGTSPITTNLVSGDFADAASNDMQPAAGGTADNTGTDIGTLYPATPSAGEVGVDGNTFDATWNIGAFALSASGATIPIFQNHYRQMNG